MSEPADDTPADVPVHEALRRIKRDLGAIGREGQMNQDGGYKYRKVDDIVERVSPLQVLHGVLAAPRVRSSRTEVRLNRSGNPMEYVHTEVEWIVTGPRGDVFRTPDGLLPCTFSEASDTSDKAANKAATASLKMLWSQLLNIPYSGSDPDDERTEMGNASEPRWTREQLERANALQEILDHLPESYADKAIARVAKRAGVKVDKVPDVLALGPDWLAYWDGLLHEALAAADADAPDEARQG